jgi:hypothetical protein
VVLVIDRFYVVVLQLFFKGKTVTENGYITSVRKNAVYVLIPHYGIELPLFLDQTKFVPPFVYDDMVGTPHPLRIKYEYEHNLSML